MPRQISFDPQLFRDPAFIALSFEQRMEFLEFIRADTIENRNSTLNHAQAARLYEAMLERGLLHVTK